MQPWQMSENIIKNQDVLELPEILNKETKHHSFSFKCETWFYGCEEASLFFVDLIDELTSLKLKRNY